MLGIANRPVEDVVRFFTERGVEAGILVPTSTGLTKSIMDAHAPLCDFLHKGGLHDYEHQLQGQSAKVFVPTRLLGPDTSQQTNTSLYRPESKDGDPRIWISGLPSYAAPGDVLALLAHDGELWVANASIPGVLSSGEDVSTPLGRLLREIAAKNDEPAAELLRKLRSVAAKGYLPTMRAGPTGVGMTLETLLGIDSNSSKSPDYRGIELKATRTAKGRKKQTSRVTLFSKVPDWKASAVTNPVDLLGIYGYDKMGRRQLYCSMNNSPNTLGLFLRTEGELLHASHATHTSDVSDSTWSTPTNIVQWPMSGLRASLAEKHQQTFWVKAASRKGACGEEFHYQSVFHTRGPLVANLKTLLELGAVEVDFVLHLLQREPHERPRARDHGYLFKIAPKNIDLLFPPSEHHSLV